MYEICMMRGQSYTTYEIEANAVNTIADGRIIQFINGDKVVFSVGANNLVYYKHVESKPKSTQTVQEFLAEMGLDKKIDEEIAKLEQKPKGSKFDKYFSPKKK